jgi:hypothetical protein
VLKRLDLICCVLLAAAAPAACQEARSGVAVNVEGSEAVCPSCKGAGFLSQSGFRFDSEGGKVPFTNRWLCTKCDGAGRLLLLPGKKITDNGGTLKLVTPESAALKLALNLEYAQAEVRRCEAALDLARKQLETAQKAAEQKDKPADAPAIAPEKPNPAPPPAPAGKLPASAPAEREKL